MKTLFAFLVMSAMSGLVMAQDHAQETGKKVPDIQLMDIDGKTHSMADLGFKGPVIINFWATWCSPCKKELNTIHEVYADWVAETDVTLVAVSMDDEKTKNQVAVYANGKSWDYLVLLDPNGDFKRAMGVNNPPHTFIVDQEGYIVYSHNSYSAGDEDALYEKIKALTAK